MRLRHQARKLFAAIACIGMLGASVAKDAMAYPDRPIRMLVGYAPGGGIDILGRFLAQRLGEELGQTVIVENRAGASGTIAARALKMAQADGYTIFMGESASLVAPALQIASYDPVKDFQPIGQVGALIYGIAVNRDVPAKSMEELLELVRKSPGKYYYGTPGVGNIIHLGAERLVRDSKLQMEHVPYKGGGPMLADLMSGQIAIGMTSLASLVGPQESGRIRLVGVSSTERSKLFPDAQAVSEIRPGFEAVSNIYLVAPAGTPDEAVRKVNAALNKVMQTEAAKTYFADQGSLVRLGTPEQLGKLIEEEVGQWGELVQEIGISAQ